MSCMQTHSHAYRFKYTSKQDEEKRHERIVKMNLVWHTQISMWKWICACVCFSQIHDCLNDTNTNWEHIPSAADWLTDWRYSVYHPNWFNWIHFKSIETSNETRGNERSLWTPCGDDDIGQTCKRFRCCKEHSWLKIDGNVSEKDSEINERDVCEVHVLANRRNYKVERV